MDHTMLKLLLLLYLPRTASAASWEEPLHSLIVGLPGDLPLDDQRFTGEPVQGAPQRAWRRVRAPTGELLLAHAAGIALESLELPDELTVTAGRSLRRRRGPCGVQRGRQVVIQRAEDTLRLSPGETGWLGPYRVTLERLSEQVGESRCDDQGGNAAELWLHRSHADTIAVPTGQQLARAGELPELCWSAGGDCVDTTQPAGGQGQEFDVTDETGSAVRVAVDVDGARLHPWVSRQSLQPVVTRRVVWPADGSDARLVLLPGLPAAEDRVPLTSPLIASVPISDSASGTTWSVEHSPAPLIAPSIGRPVRLAPHTALVAHPDSRADLLATVADTPLDATALRTEDGWTLIRVVRADLIAQGWMEGAPEDRRLSGVCGGAFSSGAWGDRREKRAWLPADTALYARPIGPEVGRTTEEKTWPVHLDEHGAWQARLDLPWGPAHLTFDPAVLHDPELDALREWSVDGLWARVGDGCLPLTLTLADGPLPTGAITRPAPPRDGMTCVESTSLAWLGAGRIQWSGPGGRCSSPDGRGSGWGRGELWTSSWTQDTDGWAELGGLRAHPSREVCAAALE